MNQNTLNLFDHLRESYHFLTHVIDKRTNHLPYFLIAYNPRKGGRFEHHRFWDFTENVGRWIYTLNFVRAALGKKEMCREVEALKGLALSSFTQTHWLSCRCQSTFIDRPHVGPTRPPPGGGCFAQTA